ncbi:hypothetical protein [Bradyrhizobium sp.]|uniref:hypothetical protein n=1 Tax=Bradyrhizobium sp. TaxID=376 RepID=UPI0039E5887A
MADIVPRYAVLFKTHYWDDFVDRRFRHLLDQVGSGDVYVFVDETRGSIGPIPHDRVIRATERDVEKIELLLQPAGNVFWYNADYALYFLLTQDSTYDYYLMCEYDTVFNIDIDDFITSAAGKRADYVGSPLARSSDWTETCDGVYPESFAVISWLNAISLHSKRAVAFLYERRKALTLRYKATEITNWPYSEAFISTEMHNNDFSVSKLGDYGKVEKFDWWPPTHEKDLSSLQGQQFVHPVLDEQKYIASCFKFGRLQTYFWPNGQMRQLLERSSSFSTIPAFLARAFWIEVFRRARRRFA